MLNRVKNGPYFILLALSVAALGGAVIGAIEQKTIHASDAPKKASSDAQAKILRLQLQASRIQTQYQACQAQDFQNQFNRTSVEIITASDDALKEAKLDKKEWELNLETFDFVRRTSPTEPKK